MTVAQLGDGASQWGEFSSWWGSLVDPFFGLLGPLFPLGVALVLATMLYVYSGNLAMPAVVGVLVGGYVITLMPAPAQTAAQLVIFAAIAIGLYLVFVGRGQGGRL